jgi:hypothetical protein
VASFCRLGYVRFVGGMVLVEKEVLKIIVGGKTCRNKDDEF